ncbi:MAG: transposase [Polyangiaceae bacterium]
MFIRRRSSHVRSLRSKADGLGRRSGPSGRCTASWRRCADGCSRSRSHVTMEGTGVYWIPVYTVLEGHVDLTVVNARHVKKVPGRKTDVSDAEWLASLLRHGLLRKSFVPAEREIRVIRDVCRYRRMLVQSRRPREPDHQVARDDRHQARQCRDRRLRQIWDGDGASHRRRQRFGRDDGAVRRLTCVASFQTCASLWMSWSLIIIRIMLRDQLARLDRTSEEIARYDARLDELVKPYAASMELLHHPRGCSGSQRSTPGFSPRLGPTWRLSGRRPLRVVGRYMPGSNESAGREQHPGVGGKPLSEHRRGRPRRDQEELVLQGQVHRLKARRGFLACRLRDREQARRCGLPSAGSRPDLRDLGASFLDGRDVTKTATKLIERLRNLPIDPRELSALLSQTLASSTPAPSAAISAT